MKKKKWLMFLSVSLLCSLSSMAASEEEISYVQEYYSEMLAECEQGNWKQVAKKARFVAGEFPSTPFAQEAAYYEALALFQLKQYEAANEKFTQYLRKVSSMKHFEEAIHYKFQIAEKFRTGTKAHLFGWKRLPRMTSSIDQAFQIYDEVISSLPNHEIAARSLYGKGLLLIKDHDYRAAVEVFHTLIRRFPKHELTPQAYVEINRAYCIQCQREFPDPDALDLAEINLRKFREDFPGEQKFDLAENYVLEMHEIFAQSLFETGEFYERTKKLQAALIYYTQVLRKYPLTEVANAAAKRLAIVEEKIAKAEQKKKIKDEKKSKKEALPEKA